MPYAPSAGADLWFEEAGAGHPILFVHEFGADHREWEAQLRHFARSHRCVAYAARGYPPSDVPDDPALYGQHHAAADIGAVLDHLGIARAHLVGCSMGAFAALRFALDAPDRASALVLAGVGSGSAPGALEGFRAENLARSARLLADGWAAMAEETGLGPTRIQLRRKDPRGWATWMAHLRGHSALGSAMTMRHYQGARDPITAWEPALRALPVPTLIAVGDEDAPCIEPSLFLKRVLPRAELWMHPGSGHALNLEEPAAFNAAVERFLVAVERMVLPADRAP